MMNPILIKDFSEIDFVNIDASRDLFKLPDGRTFRFSNHMCDNCWTGGTVLETLVVPIEYYCVLCQNDLMPVSFENDFLPPTGDKLEFLLPSKWTKEEQEKWYNEFKERRLAQEKLKDNILRNGNE